MGLILLAAGCASSPPQHLKDARSAYQQAAEGPAKDLAPAQLHAAQVSLTLAEKTFEDEGNSANARDRAYVAMRKAELAQVQANIARDTQLVQQAEQRNQQMAQQQQHDLQQQLQQTREQLNAETQRRQEAEAAQQKALEQLGNVKDEARGTVITIPGSVSFASGKATLMPSARNRIQQVAEALKQGDASSKIIVEGHTDATGSTQKNLQLSQHRADAVRQSLIAQGVPADRVEAVGFGESKPVADNASPSGRATNRRVEIVVQPGSGNQQGNGNQQNNGRRPGNENQPAPGGAG
ncbi:MAG TPA: OmpA family protein [Polyangiaceae bacterium]|nr:OmpA family protein [Polyangiaceae bacterium]